MNYKSFKMRKIHTLAYIKIIALLTGLLICSHTKAQLPERYEGLAPESPFGLDIREEMPEKADICNDLGVKWVRGIEHEYFSQWGEDYEDAQNKIRAMKERGIMPIPVLFYPQQWICSGLGPPADWDGYVQSAYNMIEACQSQVDYFEHWNEPWVDEWAWNCGTAEMYRQLVKDIWVKVRENPELDHVRLIGGGSTAYNRDVLYAKNHDIGYVDGSVNHAYSFPNSNVFGLVLMQMKLDKMYSKSQGVGGAWQTEFGTYTEMFSSDGETWVAKTIAPSYLLHMLAGHYADRTVRAFWFNWSGHGMHDIVDNEDAKNAYRTMTRVLEGTRITTGLYAASKAMWGVVLEDDYSNDSRARAVVWADGPYSGDIGNPWEPGGGGGAGSVPSDIYQGVMSISGSGIQAYDYLGNEITDLTNIPLNPVSVIYFLADMPTSQLQSVLENADFHLKTEVKITAQSIMGPVIKGRTIDIKLENVVNKPRSGSVTITPPAGWTLTTHSLPFENLAPGEVTILGFPIESFETNFSNKYDIDYSLSVDGKISANTGSWTIQCAYAPKRTITVDGNLDDWDGIIGTSMGDGDYQFKVAWDDDYFYFAAEIKDDTHNPFPPFDPGFEWFRSNRIDGAKGDDNRSGVFIAIDCLDDNPDDLLKGSPYYEKACAADVDYEFFATYCIGNVEELWRYRAPGTNHQGYYPTNSKLTPALGKMDLSPSGGSEGIINFSRSGNTTYYEGAIAWNAIPDLKDQLDQLAPGEYYTPNLAWRVNGGNSGKKFWTIESGQWEQGLYGFVPMWVSGSFQNGGRVISPWAFINGDGMSLPVE